MAMFILEYIRHFLLEFWQKHVNEVNVCLPNLTFRMVRIGAGGFIPYKLSGHNIQPSLAGFQYGFIAKAGFYSLENT